MGMELCKGYASEHTHTFLLPKARGSARRRTARALAAATIPVAAVPLPMQQHVDELQLQVPVGQVCSGPAGRYTVCAAGLDAVEMVQVAVCHQGSVLQ